MKDTVKELTAGTPGLTVEAAPPPVDHNMLGAITAEMKGRPGATGCLTPKQLEAMQKEDASQQSTVRAVLQALGRDPGSPVDNIADLVKIAQQDAESDSNDIETSEDSREALLQEIDTMGTTTTAGPTLLDEVARFRDTKDLGQWFWRAMLPAGLPHKTQYPEGIYSALVDRALEMMRDTETLSSYVDWYRTFNRGAWGGWALCRTIFVMCFGAALSELVVPPDLPEASD